MRDNKAFASLSSGLLARKGQARPAMRPQGFSPNPVPTDDLGWNDMGHDVPRIAGAVLPAGLSGAPSMPPPVAAVPEVVRQQDEIAREFAAAAEAPPPVDIVEAAPATEPAVEEAATPAAAAPVQKARSRPSAKRAAPSVAVRTDSRKAAFTLRLEAERHLLLRLACVVQNRSAQQIVTEALDRLLADLPDVARLAASLPQQR
jgi:hypothetical protein